MPRGLLALFFLASSVPAAIAETFVIENVGIYDVLTGDVSAPSDVTVVDGVIVEITPADVSNQASDQPGVDASDLAMLPGLIDSHVHINERDLGVLLANGVTAVRELNGSADHLALRERIANNAIVGPRMLVSSPLVSGREIDFRHTLIESPADAKSLVLEVAASGYDYLKVYDDLEKDVYEKIVTTAHQQDVELVGHIPRDVGLGGVLSARQSLEHSEKIVVDVLGFNFSDLSMLDKAAADIANAGVVVTPTLAVHEMLSDRQSADAQRRLASSEMDYVSEGIFAWWKSMFVAPQGPHSVNENAAAFLHAQRYLTLALARMGVPILAGTDTPNPLMVPGFSLHDELEALVRGGLSSEAAIRAATYTPGRQLNWSVPIGEVKVGYAADLLLVRGNPAEDLSVLRNPEAILVAGNWLDQTALMTLLKSSRRR